MTPIGRIQEYLRRLTPLSRANLLIELERLEVCGEEIPGSAEIQEKLRAEFPDSGQAQKRGGTPSGYFFSPLEPLLVDGAPEHANSGRILRGSLAPIWEWISRDLLPTMARDYVAAMNELINADKQREARQTAAAFQTKVVKCLESTLGSSDGAAQIRAKLATYTSLQAAYGDLTKIVSVLRAQDVLAKFNAALPAKIDKFDDVTIAKVAKLLDAFRKANPEELPFALALVASRLKTPWQLILLATKAAPGKNAADIATRSYAIAISMVLDRLDDRRSTLRIVLKNNRIMVARGILIDIYDIEYALRSRIDQLDESDWGARLNNLMTVIAALVEAETSRFPGNVAHVLESRSLRGHQSLMGRLTHWAWKGRDAINEGAAYCRKLVSPPEGSRA
jgi:hypothetical protein